MHEIRLYQNLLCRKPTVDELLFRKTAECDKNIHLSLPCLKIAVRQQHARDDGRAGEAIPIAPVHDSRPWKKAAHAVLARMPLAVKEPVEAKEAIVPECLNDRLARGLRGVMNGG